MIDFTEMCHEDVVARPAGLTWLAVHPSEIYPATLRRIAEIRRTGELPGELIGADDPDGDTKQAARSLRARAKALSEKALELAQGPPPADPAQRELRAAALELARQWFTRAIQLRHGRPIGLHILADENYRL